MRRTIISVALIIIIFLCACSRAANSKVNLTVINDCDETEIYSVAISTDGSTNCGMNADNTPIENGDSFTFEMGSASSCAFDVGVADKNGRIISLDSFILSFDEGQKYTLYIVEDPTGISVVSDRS